MFIMYQTVFSSSRFGELNDCSGSQNFKCANYLADCPGARLGRFCPQVAHLRVAAGPGTLLLTHELRKLLQQPSTLCKLMRWNLQNFGPEQQDSLCACMAVWVGVMQGKQEGPRLNPP